MRARCSLRKRAESPFGPKEFPGLSGRKCLVDTAEFMSSSPPMVNLCWPTGGVCSYANEDFVWFNVRMDELDVSRGCCCSVMSGIGEIRRSLIRISDLEYFAAQLSGY